MRARRALSLFGLLAAAVSATPGMAEPATVLVFGGDGPQAPSACTGPAARAVRHFAMVSEFTQVKGLPQGLVMCQLPAAGLSSPGTVTGSYRPVGAPQYAQHGHSKGAQGDAFTMVVLSNATKGQNRAYQRWYDTDHLPSVLRNPGFISAQRYRLVSPASQRGISLPRYAAIYTLASRDIQATEDEVVRRLRSGETKMSPAFDYPSSVTRYYRDCPTTGPAGSTCPSIGH